MAEQHRIRVLSELVASKIAAGEVIERPASVLKELVENALDAGATQIDVAIAAGGKKLIRVADNGVGMGRDDALLSIERHATSKIVDVNDIERIETLGFRGEAMAAISSVSQFSMSTRTRESDAGTELVMAGGKIVDVRDKGCPPGTEVSVRNLFFNVPARRKFLRSETTELSHIRQMFIVLALSHPAAGFSLAVDDRPLYKLAASATVEGRLGELFGTDLIRDLRPVQSGGPLLSVSGWIGLPHVSRSDRAEQYGFINGRAVSSSLISFAIGEAYRAVLPRGRHPVVFLYLIMDPAQVDVNVHPAKREVRFRNPVMVRSFLVEAVSGALAARPGAHADPGLSPPASSIPLAPVSQPMLAMADWPPAKPFGYPRDSTPWVRVSTATQPPASTPSAKPGESAPDAPWTRFRVLGQVGGLYVVLETEEGLVLMDPSAAHERVLYERMLADAAKDGAMSQGLLAPETVELSPRDAARIREAMPLLKNMGFGLSEFGGDSFILDAVPVPLQEAAPAALVQGIAQELAEEAGVRGVAGTWTEEQIARAASRGAVKARRHLAPEEIEQLVTDLSKAEMPYTCPHGRPTVIFMGFGELNRKFGRA